MPLSWSNCWGLVARVRARLPGRSPECYRATLSSDGEYSTPRPVGRAAHYRPIIIPQSAAYLNIVLYLSR